MSTEPELDQSPPSEAPVADSSAPQEAASSTAETSASRIQIGSQRKEAVVPKAKAQAEEKNPATPARKKYPPPNLRAELPPDLEQEVNQALGDVAIEDLMDAGGDASSVVEELEPGARASGTVTVVHRENIFLDLGGRNQGVVPLAQFEQPPEVGQSIDVVIQGRNADDGLYEVTIPGQAVDVSDWSQVEEGLLVEARVTGHNQGGLECEVGGLRGFIPASQVSMYRVEDFSEYVEQRLPCIVTECNPARRNLVLSHRAVLERQKAEAREKLLAELEVGQIREGVVRNLRDFGAFVDLGGVDGLIPVRQLSWDRVAHPRDVLQEGQKIKVKVERFDSQTHKISLAYRDLTESPWARAGDAYHSGDRVSGKVSKLMDFGAFVKLEPGIEGLIHISELSHKRVFRVSDVLAEGQDVDVKILSVDSAAQRISLSLKALEVMPEPAKKSAGEEPVEEESPPPPRKSPSQPLKGGLGGRSGGDQFGLRW